MDYFLVTFEQLFEFKEKRNVMFKIHDFHYLYHVTLLETA